MQTYLELGVTFLQRLFWLLLRLINLSWVIKAHMHVWCLHDSLFPAAHFQVTWKQMRWNKGYSLWNIRSLEMFKIALLIKLKSSREGRMCILWIWIQDPTALICLAAVPKDIWVVGEGLRKNSFRCVDDMWTFFLTLTKQHKEFVYECIKCLK